MSFLYKYISKENIRLLIYLSSSGFVFIFSFLLTVFLTNNLSDYAFGEYKYVSNFLLVVPSFASFGVFYSTASIIAKRKTDESKHLIGAALLIVTIIATTIITILYLGIFIASLFGFDLVSNIMVYLPFLLILFVHQLFSQVYAGLGRTTSLSLYNVIPSIIRFFALLVFIYLFKFINSYVASFIFIFSHFVVIVLSITQLRIGFKNIKENTKIILYDLKKSGLFIYLSSLLTGVSTQIIGLLAANLYGFYNYGYYSLAVSLSVVFQLIGSSLAVSRFRLHANQITIPNKDFVIMTLLGFTVFSVMLVFIDKAFYWFYPQSYSTAINYLKLLSFANLLFGFMNIFNRFLIGKSMGKSILINSAITGVISIVSAIMLMHYFSFDGLVYSTLIVSVLNLSVYVITYIRYLRRVKIEI